MNPTEGMASITADQLSSIISSGQAFSFKKQDVSTTVGMVKGSALGLSNDLWVKRFNYKGFFNFIFKRLVSSRAKRLWIINQRLFKVGLPVPKPIAFFESSFKQKHSFFLSSVIENADDLGSIYVRGQFDESAGFARQFAETVAAWHLVGAVHGDLKWSNILLQESDSSRKFFFIDLDQAKLYSRPKVKGIIKDLVRFHRYGLELGAQAWVESKFFPEYMEALPAELRAEINLEYIKNTSLKIWRKKGSRKLPVNR